MYKTQITNCTKKRITGLLVYIYICIWIIPLIIPDTRILTISQPTNEKNIECENVQLPMQRVQVTKAWTMSHYCTVAFRFQHWRFLTLSIIHLSNTNNSGFWLINFTFGLGVDSFCGVGFQFLSLC